MQSRGILRIFFFLALLSSTFIAWYVTPVKSAVLQVPGQYPTIQQAVNAAGPGDIIEVAAGTYPENVIVTVRGLTIVGDNAATTIVDGGGNDAVFKIQQDNVELRELTIRNGKPYYNGVNMFTPYGGLTIRNTRIIDNALGVYIYESDSNTIEDNIFIDNSLYGIDAQYSTGNIIRDNQISESAYGIEVSDASSSQVVNNTVSGASYGIYAPSSNNNNISSNTLFDNSWNIYLTHSNSNIVGNNAISGDGAVGIQIMRSEGNAILSNTIYNSSYGIFLGYCGANTVTDNSVSLTDWGIELFNSSGSTIKENMISDNTWGFYVVENSRGNYIYHNNVINNVKQAYQDPITSGQNSWRTPTTPFEGNYWNNYIGADDGTGGRTAGDGIGDTYLPWEGVDYYPLMTPWGINRDVALISVIPSADAVYQGEIVNITVVAKNEGDWTETFDVTAKYDDNIVDTQTVSNLNRNANVTLTFAWNTTEVESGSYVISAEASVVDGETDTADNVYVDGTVIIAAEVRDVAVKSVSLLQTIAHRGYTMLEIYVMVENEGVFTENFNVTAYYNSSRIGTEVVTLPPDGNTTLIFSWNTTGVTYGNYTMSAEASFVPGEIDVADNFLVDGMVIVTIPGDISGDRMVDLSDAGEISAHWHSPPFPDGPLGYDPDADINGDGKVNIVDVSILNANWHKSW